MAEHPIIMDGKQQQVRILVKHPGSGGHGTKESVVDTPPEAAEPKKTVGQKLSAYAFGEEVSEPGKYIWKGYLEPTGKRVANDIVEHFLLMIKHTFQRWMWGKTLDNGKWNVDRTSFSNYSAQPQPVKAMVMVGPVKELTFASQSDAEKVLAELKNTIASDEKCVTVRQYYEASGRPELVESSGVSSSSGWTNLDKATVKPNADGNGYFITLPRPMSLSGG